MGAQNLKLQYNTGQKILRSDEKLAWIWESCHRVWLTPRWYRAGWPSCHCVRSIPPGSPSSGPSPVIKHYTRERRLHNRLEPQKSHRGQLFFFFLFLFLDQFYYFKILSPILLSNNNKSCSVGNKSGIQILVLLRFLTICRVRQPV